MLQYFLAYSENSQSSTDTALSSNDATTPTHNSHSDLKIKQEPVDTLENGEHLEIIFVFLFLYFLVLPFEKDKEIMKWSFADWVSWFM